MSVFDVLDATRVCGRWSAGLDDPAVWVLPAPELPRRASAQTPAGAFRWSALARNPRALVVTGMAAPLLAAEAVRRTLGVG
jgi:hypothetical protein